MQYRPIGIIHTPYVGIGDTPYQPLGTDEWAKRQFFLDVEEAYADGLYRLDTFEYIYVLYHIDRLKRPHRLRFRPAWAGDAITVGMFASRSPSRPNPIGLSVVRLLSVEGTRVYTSPLDVFDGTPLLDIKPYLRDLDAKDDANYGWVEELPDRDHLLLHIKGLPHDD